ncbi:unnamed protein product [Macrosiphum euphorbiae]|uniref:Uncharacterized protein n=1 Tax=Macrosiphum euphorbiae TaxID=13131 RepID=A0AAV0Y801_9HEMI|nr:unnamed protein product [Macrosiphum euphorbiae]
MTEAAGLWWSDSDSDSGSNNLSDVAPNSTISNMDEVDDISDSDSGNDIYRNIQINNHGEGIMGILSFRDHLDIIESIFNEVEDRYEIRDSDEDW